MPVLYLQISEETYLLLPPEQQAGFELREAVPVKGKGTLRTYLLKPPQQQQQVQQQQEEGLVALTSV
jgi:hypothetical protein